MSLCDENGESGAPPPLPPRVASRFETPSVAWDATARLTATADTFAVMPTHQVAFHRRAAVLDNVTFIAAVVIDESAMLRGDLAKISLGSYGYVGARTVIKPSFIKTKALFDPLPTSLGDYVAISSDCVIESVAIGCCVLIEEGCVLGSRSRVGDCVILRKGAVVPPGAVVAPFGVYAGQPAVRIADLHPESALFDLRELVLQLLICHAPFLFGS
jgi:carbonic anhydrase/acetyltransferase-like protein (isoleucine patch superfamily)